MSMFYSRIPRPGRSRATSSYAYLYEKDGARKSLVHPRKALAICSAGHTEQHLEETGIASAMRCIMLEDRSCSQSRAAATQHQSRESH